MIKSKKSELIYLLIFVFLSVIFFYGNLGFSYLRMGDVILWEIENTKSAILERFPYFWNNAYFTLQNPVAVALHPRNLILLITPIKIFPQVSIIFHIFIMGYSSFLFLRQKHLVLSASFFGAFAIMFGNAFVTLILPGHLGKFETYSYFPLVLLFLSLALEKEKLKYFIFTGAALGVSFLGGALDVAMYFSLFISFYFLFLLFQKKETSSIKEFFKSKTKNIITLTVKFIFVAVFSFLMSLPVIVATRNVQDDGAAGVSNKKELWNWATRWSFPPEETLGFFMPGFFGYYSGSENHPYWGRIANMKGEPKTSNMSLTSVNMGIVAFVFLLFSIALNKKIYKEKYFWIASSLFLLIAGFGRYFPLIYGLLFQIPIFRDARNPNKFIEIIHIPFGVLAAFGCDYISKVITARKEDKLLAFFNNKENNYNYLAIVKNIVFILTALFLILTLFSLIGNQFIQGVFIAEWKELSQKIARNITISFMRATLLFAFVSSLLKIIFSFKETSNIDKYIPIIPFLGFVILGVYDSGTFLFLIIGGVMASIYLFINIKESIFYKALPYVFAAVLVLDLAQSANYFIVKTDTDRMYETTPITEHILKEGGNKTTMPILIPYLYRYTTHTMPHFSITLTEPPSASRLSKEITDTFSSFRINDYATYDPRLMDLLGVRYILSPTYLDSSLIKDEIIKITEYQDEFSAAVLYELKGFRDRFEYVSSIYNATDFNDGLNYIKSENFNVASNAVLYKSDNIETENIGKANYLIDIVSENKNEIALNVTSDMNGILILKERFNSDWSVFVDGKKNTLLKANLLFRGVYLESGIHSVVFKYTPNIIYSYLSLFCWIVLIILTLYLLVSFLLKKNINNSK